MVSHSVSKTVVAHTDTQPKEKDAPKPLFIKSCVFKDLSFLLSANERDKSLIEFGAHQAILVQSKEARDNLPSILKGAINCARNIRIKGIGI